MGEEGFYPPLSLALLQEKVRNGLTLTKEEAAAVGLPYPQLPPAIRDFKFRRPQEFLNKHVSNFELCRIPNYREMFTLSKLLEAGAKKKLLSGFGTTSEEQSYNSSRKIYRFANALYYAATAAGVIGFNVAVTMPLWFKSFGIGWVALGNFAVVYGTWGFWYPIVDHFRREMIVSGAEIVRKRREELLKLQEEGALNADIGDLPEFPPNPFHQQLEEEAKKLAIWKLATAKKG